MSKSVRRAGIVLALAGLATAGMIYIGVRQSMGASCEVCITYNGRTACRSARGADQREAAVTATQNACAFLAGGMTQTIQCQNRPPDSMTCE